MLGRNTGWVGSIQRSSAFLKATCALYESDDHLRGLAAFNAELNRPDAI